MSLRFYANAPATTLAVSCTNVQTSIQVVSVTGYPIQFPYTLILDRGTASEEAVSVTAAGGTTLTVIRAIDTTTAFAHSIGAIVEHGITAQDIRESNAHVNASSGVHGLAGALVGLTDAQVLTNKTIGSTNTVNGFTASRFMEADGTGKLASGTKVIPTGAVVGTTDSQTLTTKTIDLASNTLTGTKAQFNTALSGDDFATLAGAETLTNKTLTAPTVTTPTITTPTVTGIAAASNTQGDFIGGIRYITKGADQPVTSSTVYVNDNTLTMTVTANATYRVWYHLGLTQTTAGGGKIQITLPASAALRVNPITTSGTPFAVTSGNTGSNTTSPYQTVVPAILAVAGTAGSITVQFAQDVSDPASTVMKANSYLAVERIA